ncbi:MAG TPA: VanZ family protein [Pontiellaceae bacterium]|nr:VanZ family protein [Pontiellaceae bacterium]
MRDCLPMQATISKRNLFAGVFAVLTVGTMALFFNIYEPWRPVGPELIPDGSFSTPAATNVWSGWNEWTKLVPAGGFGGSPGVVLTASSNQHGILRFTAHDLTNIPAFRVSLRAAAHGVVRGKEGYHIPRAVFFYNDAQAKSLFKLHHGVMDIPKDRGWHHYKDFFPVPEGAVDARLQIQNLGIAGTMQIDDVSVIPVCERPSAPWWKLFFGVLWTTAFGLCLFALKPWMRRHGFLIMLTLILIMTGIVLPGKFLDSSIEKTVHTAKELIHKTAPPPPVQAVKTSPAPSAPSKPKGETPFIALAGTLIDQVHTTGHFILFSWLALLASLSWIAAPPALRRITAVFAGLAFFAAATETLQFITIDRAAALSDLCVDIVGMAGAVALVFVLRGIQYAVRLLINRD